MTESDWPAFVKVRDGYAGKDAQGPLVKGVREKDMCARQNVLVDLSKSQQSSTMGRDASAEEWFNFGLFRLAALQRKLNGKALFTILF